MSDDGSRDDAHDGGMLMLSSVNACKYAGKNVGRYRYIV